ncbi:hypothetical protein FJT64_018411 [Amphibalanus amphitrite]|uniref:Uncharacterized protein n=1 Tax=Amphibalanus amphitrite TaxID=1232801 RepID=A0A6A4WUW4_AMPAM|nr:hypothetical protein FJT64_018411 [Amphibalanus amphitrite]
MYQQVLEEHDEEWQARQLRFLADIVGFQKYVRNPPPPFPDSGAATAATSSRAAATATSSHAAATATSSTGATPASTAATSRAITVDHYNIPGFAEVDQLAQSLVSLVDVDGLVLHSMQVERLHQLWRRLHAHDRGRTVSTSIRSACVTRMHNYWRVGRRLGAMAGN